jgi:hypothetical protein
MLARRRNTNTHFDDAGFFFGPTNCGFLRRSRCAQHLLAGLDRGADWLRSGPAQWDGRVAHRDSAFVNRSVLALAAALADWCQARRRLRVARELDSSRFFDVGPVKGDGPEYTGSTEAKGGVLNMDNPLTTTHNRPC